LHRSEVKWSRTRGVAVCEPAVPARRRKIKVSRGELNNKSPEPGPESSCNASVVLAQKYLVGRGST